MTNDKIHILITGASRGIGKAILTAIQSDAVKAVGQSTANESDLLSAISGNRKVLGYAGKKR